LGENQDKDPKDLQPAPDRPTNAISMQNVILWMKTADRLPDSDLLEHGAPLASTSEKLNDWWSKMPIAPTYMWEMAV